MRDLQPIVDTSVTTPGRPLIIAGPCAAESHDQIMQTALQLAHAGIKIFRAGIWKPRTRPGSFEGIGAPALPWLTDVKARTGMLTATEVATPDHVIDALHHHIDILWIGARTTANPFAVQQIADTIADINPDTPVLVKNPVNPDIDLWIGALQRLYNAGLHRLGAIHRGFSAYGDHTYRNSPLWHIPIELRRRYPALPIITDPSHIAGNRQLIATLSQQSLDMGFDGLIIETHPDPDHALSDPAQQLTPTDLITLISSLVSRPHTTPTEPLTLMRQQIDALDADILNALDKRMQLSRHIGQYKQQHNIPIIQPERYDTMLTERLNLAATLGLDPDFTRHLLTLIHAESVRQQLPH